MKRHFQTARWWAMGVAAVLALAAGGGCVAIPIGEPETFTKEFPGVIHDVGTPRVSSRTPRERIQGRDAAGRRIVWIGLEGEIVSEQEREQCWQSIAIVKQRRLAFGLVPGRAEKVWDGDFAPDEGADLSSTVSSDSVMGFMLGFYVTIPWKLLVEPFYGDWECAHHGWKPSAGGQSAMNHFSRQELCSMGLEPSEANDFLAGFSHACLIGFHRHCKYTVQGPVMLEKRTPAPPTTLRSIRKVQGPYRVALELPDCGFVRTLDVPRGESGVDFDLGGVHSVADTSHAIIRFLPPAGGAEESRHPDDRALLSLAQGRVFDALIQVKSAERHESPPSSPPGGGQTVVEYHHYHETKVVETRKPLESPWEIETVEPFRDGRAEYLVTIRDASKKAFDVEREVKPEIERLLREAFLAERPGLDASVARAFALPEFKGRTILFKGVAFSMQPVSDGWRYDSDTQRGMVRLWVSEWMTPEEAKRWARENIEAIVKEKNVALEAGEAPPEGAVYRSLGESLENGVLTVEFEAVE